MSSKLYVGNLPFSIEEEELKQIMSEMGTVVSVYMPTDHATGRRRGFAFVEMETAEQAQGAIDKLNGKDMQGREVVVNLAKEKPPRKRF